ncbi:hypothetical protein ACLOJK_001266 [Asimina triloba]
MPDHQPSSSKTRLFQRQRPLHALLGGGRVADAILWRNKHLSAAILIGVSAIWFLFEVAEYHFLTLLGHLSITTMLTVFIWSNAAALLDKNPPKIPETILSEPAFKALAMNFHAKLSAFLRMLHDIATGKDVKLFLLSIASLWMLSVIGSYGSTLNLLYLAFLCIQTLPALYERYEDDVDYLAGKGSSDLKELYNKFDSKILNKIPRGPVKDRKF